MSDQWGMEYAIYVWSLLAASLLALLLYCKTLRQKASTEDGDKTPSLFENITFMKSEIVSNKPARRRTSSTLKKRRSQGSQEFSLEYKYSQQVMHDFLVN